MDRADDQPKGRESVALERLRQRTESDAAIALVNLLKFAPAVDVGGERISGAEAYAAYVACVEPAVLREGGRPVFRARGSTVLLGPADQEWDEIVIVWYPSRRAFEKVVESDEYRASAGQREAALLDAQLIAVSAPQRIGRLTAALYAQVVRFRTKRSPAGT